MPNFEDLNSAALGKLNRAQLLCIGLDVDANATGGLAFSLPYSIEIVNVIARSTATNASATVQVSDGTNNITNAIAIATLDTNTAASTIDTTHSTTGDVTLTTNGAADRCRVFIIGIRTE